MRMFDEDSLTGNIVASLFLGGLFYLFQENGKSIAYKEMEEKKRDEKIANLEKMVRDFNSGR